MSWWLSRASEICFRLLTHCAQRAASRSHLHGRQYQRDKNADDRDHDQQFYQRKALRPEWSESLARPRPRQIPYE